MGWNDMATDRRVVPGLKRAKAYRRAEKRPGDGLGRIRCAIGVAREDAIAAARTKPWWPRVRSAAPTLSHGWWCWPLRAP